VRRPTLNDVAAEAGVSAKSVSRVINGASNISPELRRRVETAVEKLNYVPNTLARALKMGIGDTVGVVIDSISDPFFAALTSAVEAAAVEAGLGTVFGSTGLDPAREREQVERMIMRQVKALILAPVRRSHDYLRRYAAQMPIVLVDRTVEGQLFDTVRVDDRGDARAAVDHLLAVGHRRIAFVGADDRYSTICDRLLGYRDALAAHGIEAAAELCCPQPVTDADSVALLAGLRTFPEPATALFAATSRDAIRLVFAMHTTDTTDLALISFGDFPLSRSLRPPVTVVDHDPVLIGRTAMQRVLDGLGGEHGPPRDIVVPTRLVPRGSGEIRPSEVST